MLKRTYLLETKDCVILGIGALFIRRRPRVRVVPVQSGGGQERGIRSGTVPTPLVVGLGAACHLAQHELEVALLTYFLTY